MRAIAALLNEEHDDVDALARAVLDKVNELWSARDTYVCLLRQPTLGLSVYGPYDTENQAKRALGKDVIAAEEGARGGTFKVWSIK